MCKAFGVTDDEVQKAGTLEVLPVDAQRKLPSQFFRAPIGLGPGHSEKGVDSPLTQDFVRINDDYYLGEEARESYLTMLFGQAGLTVTFV